MTAAGFPTFSYRVLRVVLGVGLAVAFVAAAAHPAGAAVFSNTAPITINDSAAASPYPSAIAVSGLTGTTTDVNVTLVNFNHTFSDDVGVVLVPPAGTNILLMDGAGDDPDIVNQTLTFDDAAVAVLPNATGFSTGSYKPTAYFTGDSFAAPGPLTAYCNPGPAGVPPFCTLASALNGSNPNGTWNLFVRDFVGGDSGSIGGGWSLDITASPPATSPVLLPAPPPDTAPPDTTLGKHPPKKTTKHKVKFTFSSSEVGSTFKCKLDKSSFKACASPFKKTVGVGKHTFEVEAVDAAGNVDPTFAKFKFSVLQS